MEEGKGENNQERRNAGKRDGEGRRNAIWKLGVMVSAGTSVFLEPVQWHGGVGV